MLSWNEHHFFATNTTRRASSTYNGITAPGTELSISISGEAGILPADGSLALLGTGVVNFFGRGCSNPDPFGCGVVLFTFSGTATGDAIVFFSSFPFPPDRTIYQATNVLLENLETIPELSSMLLLSTSLAGLVAYGRRRFFKGLVKPSR